MSRKRESLRGKGSSIFLGGEDQAPREEENGEPRKPESKKTIKPEGRKTSEPAYQPLDLSTTDKEKATYNLPSSVVAALDEVWMEARRATGKKVSKSDIVALALDGVIRDVRAWKAGETKGCELIERLTP